jgi:monovalent cation/hydrogen antiporter
LQAELNYFNVQLQQDDAAADSVKEFQQLYLDLLEEQRKLMDKINHKAEFDEELVRKYLSLIDMEEFKIREKQTYYNADAGA